MYTFQDIDVVNSAWDVLSLAAIFLVGVYIALAGYRHHRVPQGLALLMYFWHTIFCVFYLNYSLAVGSDAVHYFINSQDLSGKPELGTSAITLLTASLTQGLKLSYGGFPSFQHSRVLGDAGTYVSGSRINPGFGQERAFVGFDHFTFARVERLERCFREGRD